MKTYHSIPLIRRGLLRNRGTGCGDARKLQLSRPVEAVITSPPDPGVYSYANAAWLRY